jgi:hypothetical protein
MKSTSPIRLAALGRPDILLEAGEQIEGTLEVFGAIGTAVVLGEVGNEERVRTSAGGESLGGVVAAR